MNWIKSNPFVSGLAGITLLLCGILYFFASKWGTQHEEAQASFDEAFQGVSKAESIPLYPNVDLRNGKSKALTDYREAIADLAKLFHKYSPKNKENISPQAFTDRLLADNNEVTKAFGQTQLPENFFLGFEGYRSQLAKTEATATLLNQLDGIKAALLRLAKSRPSALTKVFRVPVPEETGGAFQAAPNDIARYYSYEITFKGSEESARKFFSSLGATDTHYFVIRTIKIMNERDTPPQVTDAKFEKSEAEKEVSQPTEPFGAGFLNLSDPEQEVAEPNSETTEADKAVPAAPAVDTSAILAQVLGNEELIFFVRFDVAQFLPTKELPKP